MISKKQIPITLSPEKSCLATNSSLDEFKKKRHIKYKYDLNDLKEFPELQRPNSGCEFGVEAAISSEEKDNRSYANNQISSENQLRMINDVYLKDNNNFGQSYVDTIKQSSTYSLGIFNKPNDDNLDGLKTFDVLKNDNYLAKYDKIGVTRENLQEKNMEYTLNSALPHKSEQEKNVLPLESENFIKDQKKQTSEACYDDFFYPVQSYQNLSLRAHITENDCLMQISAHENQIHNKCNSNLEERFDSTRFGKYHSTIYKNENMHDIKVDSFSDKENMQHYHDYEFINIFKTDSIENKIKKTKCRIK
ncbi:hypothetical protein EDEG_03756 [Edhazardia aedis USNM 41457]|uniref:Uncharacterized protein n=1 Tax=Edhazardia aedis (strain USNM 41457) TaxID=1003232 RepID=J8ZPU2_EDHAE|nr:hypothetical protein EDEG_03756 [Edhazardia aedis USNM 41457]|eukprot:EJW01713.1 hypothetical protein EDEG_03756 [Edhazardia aedis USNM 41457]